MKTFLFVPGFPTNVDAWGELLERCPAGARAIAWDPPDCGASPDLLEIDVRAYEVALARRVRSVEGNCVLVGHSIGAWLVARVADALPQVERVVLVDGLPLMPRELVAGHVSLVDALDSGAITMEQVTTIALEAWFRPGELRERFTERVTRMLRRETPARVARAFRRYEQIANDPALEARALAKPATILHVADDPSVPLALGREFAARCEYATFHLLEGSGHFPQWTHVEESAALVFGPAPR